jgi:hypothetical protein
MLIDKNKVPFKYIIGYKDCDPLHLLYQILTYLGFSEREDMEFTVPEVNMHTTVREDGKALPLIEKLVASGHVEKVKGVKYRVVLNPWT